MSRRQRNKITGVGTIKRGYGFLIFTKNGSVGFSLPPKPTLNNFFQFNGKLSHHFPHLYDEIIAIIRHASKDGIVLKDFQKYLIGKYVYGKRVKVFYENKFFFNLT